MKRLVTPLTLGAIFLFVIALFSPVHAEGGIEIYPAVIDVTIEDNVEPEPIVFTVINHEQDSVNLDLKALNFNQRDVTGIVQFFGQDSTNFSYSLASFLKLPFSNITLEPGEEREIEVVVEDRLDLSPGGHYAGVVLTVISEDDEPEPVVQPSVSTLIFLRKVGGERFNLSLRDVSWPQSSIQFTHPQSLTLTFQNEGNIHVVPRGLIQIKDIFDRVIYEGTINNASSNVFPSSRRDIEIDIKQIQYVFPIGIHSLEINGNDSLKKTNFTYQNSYIYIHPAVVIVLILLLLIGVQKFMRKFKHS